MQDFTVTIVLAIILVVVVFYAVYTMKQQKTSESYANLAPANYPPTNSFNPGYYQPELGILNSASDFIGLPSQIIPAWTDDSDIPGFNQNFGNAGLGFNLCSKSCCSPQYPPPFSLPKDDIVLNSGEKYVGTSFGCTNTWQDSGCLCMTTEQGEFLDSHGGNK